MIFMILAGGTDLSECHCGTESSSVFPQSLAGADLQFVPQLFISHRLQIDASRGQNGSAPCDRTALSEIS
jgi:hypothetical protein